MNFAAGNGLSVVKKAFLCFYKLVFLLVGSGSGMIIPYPRKTFRIRPDPDPQPCLWCKTNLDLNLTFITLTVAPAYLWLPFLLLSWVSHFYYILMKLGKLNYFYTTELILISNLTCYHSDRRVSLFLISYF